MKKLALGILVWILSYPVAAIAPHNLLIQKFDAIKSIDAHFHQVVLMNGRRVSSSDGQFVVLRPGKLRWSVTKPHKQLYVADGKTIWIYEPELNQVTQRPQTKGLGGTAGLFLSNQPSLWIQRYKVTIPQGGAQTVFELRAKTSQTPFSRVLLIFKKDTLVGLEFWDQMGQNSQIRLSQVKMNATIPLKVFHFSAPAHTDKINL
jgi:outer membrane lipoprotein carrier protein